MRAVVYTSAAVLTRTTFLLTNLAQMLTAIAIKCWITFALKAVHFVFADSFIHTWVWRAIVNVRLAEISAEAWWTRAVELQFSKSRFAARTIICARVLSTNTHSDLATDSSIIAGAITLVRVKHILTTATVEARISIALVNLLLASDTRKATFTGTSEASSRSIINATSSILAR